MTRLDLPTSISRASLMDYVRSLGINPDQVEMVKITLHGVRALVNARNHEGEFYYHPNGDKVQHTIAIDFVD